MLIERRTKLSGVGCQAEMESRKIDSTLKVLCVFAQK